MSDQDSLIDQMKCPFCGKSDIEFGLALCVNCNAEIYYELDPKGIRLPRKTQEDFDARMADIQQRWERNRKRWMGMPDHSRMISRMMDEYEADWDAEQARARQAAFQGPERPPVIVSFIRGRRRIDVPDYLPARFLQLPPGDQPGQPNHRGAGTGMAERRSLPRSQMLFVSALMVGNLTSDRATGYSDSTQDSAGSLSGVDHAYDDYGSSGASGDYGASSDSSDS